MSMSSSSDSVNQIKNGLLDVGCPTIHFIWDRHTTDEHFKHGKVTRSHVALRHKGDAVECGGGASSSDHPIPTSRVTSCYENFPKGSTSTVGPVQTDALHASKLQGLICHGYTNISPLPHTTALQYFVRKHQQFTCKTILMSAAIFSERMVRMRTIFCRLHPLETTKSTIKIELVCVYSYVIIKDVKHELNCVRTAMVHIQNARNNSAISLIAYPPSENAFTRTNQ